MRYRKKVKNRKRDGWRFSRTADRTHKRNLQKPNPTQLRGGHRI